MLCLEHGDATHAAKLDELIRYAVSDDRAMSSGLLPVLIKRIAPR
ncbi:hypothetical protein DB30_02188 [Enhygromyxa salina]|uniref:Uncharacterized protein n=1 Tax=Enhygromyxa salina TaxID=215803 RepID=A0A0C2A3L0_9BACT|nr:hypothetical protein DB30_02188 [Enhygromyxa salina]